MLKVSGWGRTIFSESRLFHLPLSQIIEHVADGRGAIPRGLGRSYGDSAQNSGGVIIECGNFKQILIDSLTGVATVGSGVTIEELEIESLKFGYFPFVVPGTGQITVGGAVASDIHGKSHHRVGSFCDHILEITIILANGEKRTIRPKEIGDSLFEATVGGLGLTGVITEVKIQLMLIATNMLSVNEVRANSLEEVLRTMMEFDKEFHYTVAWLDLSGNFQGRGLVSGANFAQTVKSRVVDTGKKLRIRKRRRFSIPLIGWLNFINPITIRWFNYIWFHKPLTKKSQNVQAYLHPLDLVTNWNELYGRHGLVQYQFVVPYESAHILQLIIRKFARERISSPLTVLKSLGSQSRGLIGFSIPGWTMAIDIPANAVGLEKVLSDVDEMVRTAGGRVYLTKDSRISSKMVEQMYPKLDNWRSVKHKHDPFNLWQSDQSRRLKIC